MCVTMIFHLFTDDMKRTHGRYTCFGSRVAQKYRTHDKSRKIYVSQMAAETRRRVFQKVNMRCKDVIVLVSYEAVHIFTYNIEHLMCKMT